MTAQMNKFVRDREKNDAQQTEDGRNIERQQKNVERYLTKRQVLSERKDVINKNIRDLGVLPEEAFVETSATTQKVRFFSFSTRRIWWARLLTLSAFPLVSVVEEVA